MDDEEAEDDTINTIGALSPVAELKPQLIFGLDTTIKGNVHYINDSEVVYPIGNCLSIHNFNQRTQKFIKIADHTRTITQIIYNFPRKMIAISEIGPVISFYDLTTFKKRKNIGLPFEAQCQEFIGIDFSFDGKYLIAVLGEPEWILLYYNWRHGKLEAQTKANTASSIVTQVSGSPFDNAVCCLTGPGLFRTFSVSESVFRQFGFQKADMFDITCHCWLTFDRIAFGTTDGRIGIIESGDVKVIAYAREVTTINTKLEDEESSEAIEGEDDEEIRTETTKISDEKRISELSEKVKVSEEEDRDMADLVFSETISSTAEDDGDKNKEDYNESGVLSVPKKSYTEEIVKEIDSSVRALTYCVKGFLFSCGVGVIYVFEKENSNQYTKRAILKVVNKLEELTIPKINQVNFLSLNPSMDRIVCTTKRQQIFIGKVFGTDAEKETSVLSELGMPLHHGPICKISICMWKPLFITGGKLDRTVRIWNYELRCVQFVKQFMDDIYSVSLHPTGLYSAVGFHDKLRYFVLLIDSMKTIREIPIRCCTLICFSHGGHLFAALNDKDIQIYSTITFMQTHCLRGHSGIVTSFIFTNSDHHLISCATEGAFYEWDLPENNRVADIIVKEVKFTDLAMLSTGVLSYVLGSDGFIREISNGIVERQIPTCAQSGIKNQKVSANLMLISKSDNFMFVAGFNGLILSLQAPWNEKSEKIEYRIHRTRVTSIILTYDDRYLITVTEDGNIGIFKVVFPSEKMIKIDKEFKYSKEILIDFDDLDSKMEQIEDLGHRIRELTAEHEYTMAETVQKYEENKKIMIENYTRELSQLREIQQHEELVHHEQISNIHQDITKMKQEHSNLMQNMDTCFNKKLIVEYDKYQAMEKRCFEMKEDFEKKLEELLESKLNALKNLEKEYEEKLETKRITINEMQLEKERMILEHDTIQADIEDDADREIIEIKTKFSKELKDQTELNIKLRGEVGFLKKRLNTTKKEVDELMHKLSEMEAEHERFQNVIMKMDKNILELKRELGERDNTIQDKEKRIYELKLRCQELDKYKFVLNYKIKELKDMMEPKDREIREKKEQIFEMETELENLQFQTTKQDVRITDLREKFIANNITLNRARLKHQATLNKMRMIRIDLHNASGLIHDSMKLRSCVKHLYHKYSQDPDLVTAMEEDKCAQDEFFQQRLHLERTVLSLKWQVASGDKGSAEIFKIMDENVSLITEINQLRHSLQISEQRVRELESLLGEASRISSNEAKSKLDKALTKHYEIENEYEHKIREHEKMIVILKDEINRLMAKLSPNEQIYFAKEKRKLKEFVDNNSSTDIVTIESKEKQKK